MLIIQITHTNKAWFCPWHQSILRLGEVLSQEAWSCNTHKSGNINDTCCFYMQLRC